MRTGSFVNLPFGLTRAEFVAKLGKTRSVVCSSRRVPIPVLLRYGSVEFFITSDSHLFYGFLWEPLDEDVPQGDHALRIDPWILLGSVSRESVEQGLRQEKIEFTGGHRPDGVYSLSLGNGVRIHFQGEGNGTDTNVLCGVEAMRQDVLPYQEPEKQISVTLTRSEVELLRQQAAHHRVSVAKLCAEWIRHRLTTETPPP
ncbi:MAG: hypothetical protein H8F28_14490 [Fibrella sp.]|nr:hypothetical protein [Armatimonadota bacterium]